MSRSLFRGAALACAVLLPGVALAGEALYAADRPCAELRGAVSGPGAAILRSSPTVYDRFVRDGTFCQPGDDTRIATVRSKDVPACFVGYTCRSWSSQRA